MYVAEAYHMNIIEVEKGGSFQVLLICLEAWKQNKEIIFLGFVEGKENSYGCCLSAVTPLGKKLLKWQLALVMMDWYCVLKEHLLWEDGCLLCSW